MIAPSAILMAAGFSTVAAEARDVVAQGPRAREDRAPARCLIALCREAPVYFAPVQQ